VRCCSWGVKNYVYVSSGGMYKNTEEVPLLETDAVKETGQRKVELLAAELGLPWTSFRPQYIYGPKTNKRDYLDWFFDRVSEHTSNSGSSSSSASSSSSK
jgi:nucleoside-diphosphate-sugar epimerase